METNFLPLSKKKITIGFKYILPLAFLSVMVFISLFVWYGCRVEVEPGEIAVLLKKTGTDPVSGQIIAEQADQKGIQLDVLAEGRYFFNPYHFEWKKYAITDIPSGKLGVQIRLYGSDINPHQIIAESGEKGILKDVLGPGKYRINPFAYQIQLFDAITIKPGHVGVVTSLVGRDVLNSRIEDEKKNDFLVTEDMKGVIPAVLESGTYYLNPYLYSVFEVSIQSHRFEMSGTDAISFLTVDGFDVNVEGTIEFSLQREKSALLTHRVGDMDDIITKVILPRARGFSRIEGSKHPAVNYIVGETRQKFEDRLEEHVRETCEPWGVTISSVLIRNIIPPEEISLVIRDREVAVQNSINYDQQIIEARSRAELVKQETLAIQNREKVEAETSKLLATIKAEQELSVQLVNAEREKDIANIENQAVKAQVEAMMSEAEAEKDVIALQNEADANVIAREVKAFDGARNWVNFFVYRKIAPQISHIISGDEKGGLGAIFKSFLPRNSDKDAVK